MIPSTRSRVAAFACLLALAAATPAQADSATYALTASWQKIASAGTSVEVQNNNAAGFAVLSTATGGPPVSATGQALGPGEHRLYTLAADLYAFGTIPLVVTSGFAGTGSLPPGAATLAAQTQIDTDLKASLPRAIASNAPSLSTAGSLTNSGDTVVLAVDGMSTGLVQIGTGAWTGTAVFEASADGGTSWSAVNLVPYGGGAAMGSATAGGLWEMAVGGLTHLRVRASTTIASGPAPLVLRATNGLKSLRVGNPSGNPLTMAGTPITITASEVAVPAATSTPLLAANAARRFFSATNDGVNPCRLSYGVAAGAANGEPLAGAAASGGQGGARTFDASAITQQAVSAYCAAASSFAVLEGQ